MRRGDVPVVSSDAEVYRFKDADLSKVSAFAKGGVADSAPALTAYAKAYGPWSYDFYAAAAVPTYFFDGTFAARSGIGVTAYTAEHSVEVRPTPRPGEGDPDTDFAFSVSDDGKKIAVEGGPVDGKLPASPLHRPYLGSGADGWEFGGTFVKADGTRVSFDAGKACDVDGVFTQSDVAAADGGKYYVVGEVPSDTGTGGFALARTLAV